MIQSPPIYKLPSGHAQIILVSDGILALASPEKSFRGIPKKEIDAQLSRHFLPTDNIVIEETVLVLMSGGKRILFETGTGVSPLYPHVGHLQTSLVEAGIDPASIDAVVCSHTHPDHIGGLSILKTDLPDAKNRAAHGMINLQYTVLSAKTYRPGTYAANDHQVRPYPARCISDPGDDVA